MTEYVDKPPYIAPEEPSGPCDWLESCWEPSTDWRRDPETRGFVPVCEAHSVSTELRAPLDWVSLELSLALEAHLRDRDKWRAEVATLTTERDAAEESRRFYMAERDRLREALEAQGFQAGRHGWHSLLCMGYTGQECRAECTKAREAFALGRALAGTGETPPTEYCGICDAEGHSANIPHGGYES